MSRAPDPRSLPLLLASLACRFRVLLFCVAGWRWGLFSSSPLVMVAAVSLSWRCGWARVWCRGGDGARLQAGRAAPGSLLFLRYVGGVRGASLCDSAPRALACVGRTLIACLLVAGVIVVAATLSVWGNGATVRSGVSLIRLDRLFPLLVLVPAP